MILESTNGTNDKDVESRREYDREHESRSGACMTEDESYDGKDNG
jgi:hypothetical protein